MKKIRTQLSKVKFALGFNPQVEKKGRPEDYIPEGYRAVLTFTADFELAWAPRYDNSVPDAYAHAIRLARQERQNLPALLRLCEAFDIPITWATVGHLFLESCEANTHHERKHPEIPAVPAYQGPYWDFPGGDWFEYDPCTDVEKDPEWYAPDLIRSILASPVNHEIGCHTFSHIDCRDEVCPPEVFREELLRCQHLAQDYGLTLDSFVHPGHTIGNLDTLAGLGFRSFQTDPGNILGFPVLHPNGLWELKRTMDCYYRQEWSVDYHIYRYQKIVDRAIKSGTVCNFWFHPSLSPVFIEKVFPPLFAYIAERKDEIWITNVGDYVRWLNRER